MEFQIPVFYMKFNTGVKNNIQKQTALFMISTVLLKHNLPLLGIACVLYRMSFVAN
jgi:hypothetical protein